MITFKLKHPIAIGDKKSITEIKFRDHTTAEDYLSFDQFGGVAQMITLIASLTGTDETLVKKLSGYDYRRAREIANKILAADEEPKNDNGEADESSPLAAKPSAPA